MSNKKIWETKLTAINHDTGELQQFIAPQYFSGVNYQEAHEQLNASGIVYLQLTGNSFTSIEEASNLRQFYEDISEPYHLTMGMDYDEFHDWLSLGGVDDIVAALTRFREDGRVEKYVEMIVGYLKNKYGWEEDNEETDR